MNRIYLSTYGIAFSDYATLKQQNVTDLRIFSWVWSMPLPGRIRISTKSFTAQIDIMKGIPATIHSPFSGGICTVPGSAEEAYMDECFTKACWYYHQFHATSMVFHTNEGAFSEAEKPAKRARVREVLMLQD